MIVAAVLYFASMKRGVGALKRTFAPVSYTHLRAHETVLDLGCRLLLEKKKNKAHTNVQILL